MSDPWARLRAERTRQFTEPLDMIPRPPVPPVVAVTAEEKRRQEQAGVRREHRLVRKLALAEAAKGKQRDPS